MTAASTSSVSAAPALPSVFDFLDHRAFVSAWVAQKVQLAPGYTIGRFARRVGCTVGHVRNVLSGQRDLLAPHVEGFCKALQLEGDDAAFFTRLTRYQQATSVWERAQLLRELAGALVFRRAAVPDGAAFLCWTKLPNAAIYEAAFSPAFRADPVWLADVFGIPEAIAAESLSGLQAVGLLVPDATGRLRPLHPTLATPVDVAGPLVVPFLDRSLEAAQRALAGPASDRAYVAVMGPVPTAQIPALRDIVLGFQHRLHQRLTALQAAATDGSGPGVDTVYLAQMQFVPVEAGVAWLPDALA